MRNGIVILFAIVFVFTTCSKSPSLSDPVQELETEITGKIILPEGSPIDLNSLTILSATSSTVVNNGSFELKKNTRNFSVDFVLNEQNETVLMGYNYPNMFRHDIDAGTTALSLIMSLPIVGSLTEEGKKALIENIQGVAEFTPLVEAVSNNIIANRPLFDMSNTTLKENITALTNKLFPEGSANPDVQPLLIEAKEKTVTVKNNGVEPSYVMGVYKNGERVGESKTVDGNNSFVENISDIMNGTGGRKSDGITAEQTITFTEANQYVINIRSGKPVPNDYSEENITAWKINASRYMLGLFENFYPFAELKNDCYEEAKAQALSFVPSDAYPDISQTGIRQFSTTMLTFASTTIQHIELSSCLPGDDPFNKFFGVMKKAIAFMQWVGSGGETFSTNIMLSDLFYAKQNADTCYILNEDGLSACGDKSHSYWQGWYKAKSWEGNDYCPEFVLPMWEVPECTGMVAMEIKIEEGQASGTYLFILPEGPSFNGSFQASMNGNSVSFTLRGCPTELVFSGTGVGATATGYTPRVVDRDGNVVCDEFSYEMVRVE